MEEIKHFVYSLYETATGILSCFFFLADTKIYSVLWPSIQLLIELSIYYILGTVLGVEEKVVNNT